MRHVAAYILAVMGGKSNPTEKDIKAIMNSVGIEPEPSQLALVIKQLKGKDVFQVIAEGQELLADMPSGGVGGGSGGSTAAGAAPAVEEPKEEKKEVVEESESDSDMGMGLFDD